MTDPAGAAAHAFVADLHAPQLEAADRHHLERALRLRPGEPVTVSDGRGRWRACRFGPSLEPVGDVEETAPAVPALTVALALVKGGRPELAVQKLTELGVDRLALFPAHRSLVRWDPDRAPRHLARLRRIAREAAMQSRRVRLPTVELMGSFREAAALPGATLAQRGGEAPTLDRPTVLVGPEGGWSPEERAVLPAVALGDTVLRAETAALAAGAVLAALRAGLVAPRRARLGT